jgi:putative PEP-CTERM system histidine kinase
MIILSIELAFSGMSFRADSLNELIGWQKLWMIVTALLPGVWLVFSLAFGRANYREFLNKWRWAIISAFLVPILLTTAFNGYVFIEERSFLETSAWSLRLGWAGYAMQLAFLLCAVLILMNLERTFRTSAGAIRWRIKFIVLGIGSFFAFRIYSSSQALLYSSIRDSLQLFNVASVWIIGVFMIIGLIRMRMMKADLYFSETFLYRSFTILIVGIYLLSVGFLSEILSYFDIGHPLSIDALLILLALTGLTIVVLSDEVRMKIRRFVIRHFKKPQYDYRETWREFTERTSISIDIFHYCDKVVKWIAGIFNVSSVTIWLLNEQKDRVIIGGSTALTQEKAVESFGNGEFIQKWIVFMKGQKGLFDFDSYQTIGHEGMNWLKPSILTGERIRYGISLMVEGELIGILTLNDRMKNEPFSIEDVELLKTVATQAGGNLLNYKLAEDLRKAKEMEAFQTMSTFVVHDLKNMASTLSLTMQNLPVHVDNPEFRKDAVRVIGESVNKINLMCNHLSMLSQRIEINRAETNLNELINSSLECFNGGHDISISKDLQPIPKLMIDPEQIRKALINLILNAKEASESGGEVQVATETADGWATVSVKDNGCGMSKEFIEKSLFRPFKTTKKQGMGIGLFQSKTIVEAHGGRIEVESEEGKGSAFRIFLPIKRE